MTGFNYDYKSDSNKIAILNRLARFISNIGAEAKILIVPVSQDIDNHYNSLIERMDKKDALYKFAQAHAKGAGQYLKEKIARNSNNYVTYIITKLKVQDDIIKDLKDAFSYFVKSPLQSVYEFLSVESRDILAREISMFNNLANDYLKEQSRRITLRKCDALDIQWLYRRMYRRGMGEVKLRYNLKDGEKVAWTPFCERIIKNGEEAIRPYRKDVYSLQEGLLDFSGSRCVKVFQDDGRTSHQAFLAISHIPDGIEFPGNEWLLVLQDYPMQTEVCIHIDTVEHKKSIKDIDGKKREIKSQIQHIEDNYEDVPDELASSKEYADELEAELKASNAPICRASITFCLASDNIEELDANVKFIKETYEDCNFSLERPLADQFKLFMEFIPGAGRYMTDYVQPLPPRTLAGGMIGATRLLGDNKGPYIGNTGVLEKYVFISMGLACLRNRSAAACFLGNLGVGKSFNANLFLYLNILYGGMGLIFDPKGERTKWIEELPELREHTSIITLSTDQEDKGKLDPFLIYKDNLDEAGELALNILSELFKLNPNDDEYIAILEAIRWTKKQPEPCMSLLADHLMKFPEEDEFRDKARKVGRKIDLLREAGMAGLLFGTGNETGLTLTNRLNILQIQNLTLPDPKTPKEDYTQEETLSTVLMIPIASFAKKFAMSIKNIFKIILFDESWALSATATGIKLMNFLARMGRSLYAGCIFIGHSVNDLKGEGIKNAISYKFCFQTTDTDEARRVLEFMDLDVTEENIEEVKRLKNGQCLFMDLDGRIGKLQFDAVYEHLKIAFSTTPKEKKEGGVNAT